LTTRRTAAAFLASPSAALGHVGRLRRANGHDPPLVVFPSDVPAGPTTTQYVGRFVYTVDLASGVSTFVGAVGPQRDICAELA
jgi:hypothetical protein